MTVAPFSSSPPVPSASSASPASSEQPASAVTLLSADDALVGEVRRLAAAAGVEIVVQAPPWPEGSWPPGLVLVGADAAERLTRWRPRRSGVVLVASAHDVLDGPRLTVPHDPYSDPRTDDADDGPDVWRHAVAIGAEQVALLPDAREWLVDLMARTTEPGDRGHVIGVVGGCGGAGASLLAASLGVTAAGSGRATLLADLDPLGGGLDLALGLDDVPGLRWPDLASARGRLPSSALHASLPRAGSLAVIGCGRGEPTDLPPSAVAAVLDAAARSHDLVVVDLPRRLDAAAETALARLDELLVVVPARLRAVVAAGQLLSVVRPRTARVRAVVRHASGHRRAGRQVADALGLPLAAQLRDDPRLDLAMEGGELPGVSPRSALRRAAEQCLAGLLDVAAA